MISAWLKRVQEHSSRVHLDKRAAVDGSFPSAPPGCKGHFSEGDELIKLEIEGSLTIPTTGIKKGLTMGMLKRAQALGPDLLQTTACALAAVSCQFSKWFTNQIHA